MTPATGERGSGHFEDSGRYDHGESPEVSKDKDRKERKRETSSDNEKRRSRSRDRGGRRDRDRRRRSYTPDSDSDDDRSRRRGGRSGRRDDSRERNYRRYSPDRRRDRDRDYSRRSRRDDSRDRDYRRRDYDDRRDGRRDRDRDRDRRDRRRPDRDASEERREEARRNETLEEAMERDTRTVFVSQVTIRAQKQDLKAFFEMAGPVADVFIIKDSRTRKSKGMAYVEMQNLQDVATALALSGQNVCNLPCIVQVSQAERNRDALAKLQHSGVAASGGASGSTRIEISGLPASVLESHLTAMFQSFGPVTNTQVDRNALGVPQGRAWVTFTTGDIASNAMKNMDQQEVEGHKVTIKLAQTAPTPTTTTQVPLEAAQAAALAAAQAQAQVQAPVMNLEEGEEGGVALSAQSRIALMAKLQRGAAALSSVQPIPPPPTVSAVQIPPPTTSPDLVLVIKNMFGLDEMDNDENEFKELEDEVKVECSKFGSVEGVYASRKNPQGTVWVRFDSVPSSLAARNTMEGRFFAKRKLETSFASVQTFKEACEKHL